MKVVVSNLPVVDSGTIHIPGWKFLEKTKGAVERLVMRQGEKKEQSRTAGMTILGGRGGRLIPDCSVETKVESDKKGSKRKSSLRSTGG